MAGTVWSCVRLRPGQLVHSEHFECEQMPRLPRPLGSTKLQL